MSGDPSLRYTMYDLEITAVTTEGSRTSTYVMKGENPVPFLPGQYVHLEAPGPEYSKSRVRHMSIASSTNDTDLVFSMTNDSGSEFKRIFNTLKPGSQVRMFKIKGEFTLTNVAPGSHIVFIAGGIGITPMRGIIRQIQQEALDYSWRLIHVGREYLYEEELSRYPTPQIRIGRPALPSVLNDTVAALINNNSLKTCYMVSGSDGFVHDISRSLILNGVHAADILTENFTKKAERAFPVM
ncbi:MAG: FAD-dependent oxidoreductase [Spirochaetales bacterium]|nr:FAD-dependent oxidoreductase [Spirochaetales bacterium]